MLPRYFELLLMARRRRGACGRGSGSAAPLLCALLVAAAPFAFVPDAFAQATKLPPASVPDTTASHRQIEALIVELKSIVAGQLPKDLSVSERNEIALVDRFVSSLIVDLEAAQQLAAEANTAMLELRAKADAEQRQLAHLSSIARSRLVSAMQAIKNVR